MQDQTVLTWLYPGWQTLVRTLFLGVLAYISILLLLRVFGKRTLSKMNAFDFVVTIALGSILGSILTSRHTTLAQGGLGFALLIALQYVVAWASSRSRIVGRIIKAEPSLLAYRGEILENALRRERVARDEVLAAVRQQGSPSLAAIEAVVLETDGSFSVVQRPSSGKAEILEHVQGTEKARAAEVAAGTES